MYSRNSRTPTTGTLVALGTFVVLIVLFADFADAKRGCSAFGHACFGGHGKKRSDGDVFVAGDDGLLIDNVPDVASQQQLLYPPVALAPEMNDDLNALRGYPNYQKLVPAQLSPLVRKWLQSYRRAQEAQQDNQL